ncbi:50S ribosomal protein L11 methyltransferase [Candidatus Bathyarchaeota archaeon]|nr:50S ribosomal protein L11 methyltransferase [Candidatus Bathyarchaeota archaeon]MBS7613567.1 50S ribosomal protein L11 methyltransferase [Candidatus Bathyarchaeota archaeon]MBS7618616.1 50S ribosomal protein L11 methyltransferase [Candidatus Bathyarchaeota archaeon]
MKRRELEILLDKLKTHPSPSRFLEQYTIPAGLAARILSVATYVYNDISGKTVFDLGCGTGRLTVGAAILGANYVVGFDIDKVALEVAKSNAVKAGVSDKVDWVLCDIAKLEGYCDTVIQNPPFGTGFRGADSIFLRKALEIGHVVYTIHKSETDEFIRRLVEKYGGSISIVFKSSISIPRMFEFHRKRSYMFQVNVYRIEVDSFDRKVEEESRSPR